MAAVNEIGGPSSAPEIQYVWAVFGPAGCGKSTVAKYLADHLSLPYIEGDEVRAPSGD